MDDIIQETQQISDDQDLAKALAGINEVEATDDVDFAGVPPVMADINTQIATSEGGLVEEVDETAVIQEPKIIEAEPMVGAETDTPEVEVDVSNIPKITPPTSFGDKKGTDSLELDPIKTQALNELRPIVDKLDLPAEEKFETYLLLIRSSDDKSLIAPAHATALKIEDETKRATALLDIIKEIEYLSNPEEN